MVEREADPGRGAKLLRFDMHAHTRASHDCLCRPEAVLEMARRRGIDRLAITDHNEIRGAMALWALDPERIVVGEEVRTAEGADVIGLLLTERIPKGTPARETCERIRAQGGVVYLPHPFDSRRSGGAALLDSIGEMIDVVEAHNARTWRRTLNRRGEAWGRAHGKLLGAGSDSHSLREMGRGFVELPEFAPERDSLLGALARARLAGRGLSSPLFSVHSTYAKLHKRMFSERSEE